jgi:hypothetical protein
MVRNCHITQARNEIRDLQSTIKAMEQEMQGLRLQLESATTAGDDLLEYDPDIDVAPTDRRMEEWTLELATLAFQVYIDYIWKNWISDSQKVELSQMGIRDCAYHASRAVFPVDLLNDSKRTLQLSSLLTTHSRMLFIWKGMTPHCGYIGRSSLDMRAMHRYKGLRRTSSNIQDQITGAFILAVLL